jgi:hypothetical protein
MSENLSNPVVAVIRMVGNQDATPAFVSVEPADEQLGWPNFSPTNLPKFEIQFVEASPANASPAKESDKHNGTSKDPVVVHVTEGGTVKITGTMSVSSCFPCKH